MGSIPPDRSTPAMPTKRQNIATPAIAEADALQRTVLHALCLGATFRTRTWLHALLDMLAGRDGPRRHTADSIRAAMLAAQAAGWIEAHPSRQGLWRLATGVDEAVLLELLDHPNLDSMVEALSHVDGVADPRSPYRRFQSLETAVAVLRLQLLAGKPLDEVASRWKEACAWIGWDTAVRYATRSATSVALLKRLHPALQAQLLADRLAHVLDSWQADPWPVESLARELLATPGLQNDLRLLTLLAQYRLCSGRDGDAIESMQPLRGERDEANDRDALFQAVEGAVCAGQGRWAEAQQRYEGALSMLKKISGQRRHLLPEPLQWPYLQCLLAQRTTASLDKALRFCLAEAGQRRPTVDTPWGVVALALQMQRGDVPRQLHVFHVARGSGLDVHFWQWLMRAWLKDDGAAESLSKDESAAAQALRSGLKAAGLQRLHDQLEDALNVLHGRPVRSTFFVTGVQQTWQAALAALAGIGGAARSAASDTAAQDVRICWSVDLNSTGGIMDVVPFEQKRGARGWTKPQPVSLRKLSQSTKLAAHDAHVVACVQRAPSAGARELRLDLAGAVMALVGHPAVELKERPGVTVTLETSQPRLEVEDAGDQLRLSVHPALRAARTSWYGASAGEQRAADALGAITVIRDGSQRARVVRFTPEQRRAAMLLNDGLIVPKSASEQLQAVLQGLAAHFEVHADAGLDARDVAAISSLRAELKPAGDGLHLRLVVAPFGDDGPRCVPGHGRSRMIATVKAQTLRAVRDLAVEQEYVDQVLQACPLLAAAGDDIAEFEVLNAEDALSVLETLSKLDYVQALDWPAGRAVSVVPVELRQLRVQVRAEREWFALSGGVPIDEAQVLGIEQLLQWSASARGRFVPLGEGRYLALTQELRSRIADLAAVAEVQRGQTTVPAAAIAWLDHALQGADWQADEVLLQRLDRLAASRQQEPQLPAALQAQLRTYQLEGYQWAMRLASAGWGACLADDMGLGKTLQALAVLQARAAGGPALVVAPTSLTGNWLGEARRFAPSLTLSLYADDANRDALLRDANAGEVVLVSYQLLQLNAEAFAARPWHTLVLDEAQALKNSAAKRTQAVQTLQADFRLALSGTPIENRLAELWSIMQVCNAGLLGSLARFNERFAGPIERERDREAQRTLKRLVAPFVLRRTKAQVLDDLPPRTELALMVQPDEHERAHYEALRRQALASSEAVLAEGGGQAQINVLAQLTRLRRAACDPRLVSPQLGRAGSKVQAFGELAAELVANGHKALVFSQFVDFLGLLREPLDAAGIQYQYLDGSTPAAERTRRVAAFQAGVGSLFLISLKAGGFGLNLTVADYVVIADPWWNPAAEDQASGRAHRIGQVRPVTVYRLVNAGTLEERIVELHQHKRALAEGVLEGADTGGVLDARALVELMRG